MFSFLNPYKYVIDALVLAIVVGALAFGIHKYNTYQQDIGEARVQAQWTAQKLVDQQAAETLRINFQKEKDDAAKQRQADAQIASTSASAAAQSSRVLGDTVKTILARSASDSLEANRKYTAAIGEVFNNCKDEYRRLGQEAQGHADDSLMYQRSWPVAPAK